VNLELGLVLAGAFLASAHCIGMCGCFAVLAGGASRTTGQRLRAQLVYSSGRLLTYAFIGAVCGFLGATLLASTWGVWLSSALAYLSAALFVVIGLQILGLWDLLGGAGHRLAGWLSLGLAPAIRQFSGEGTLRGTLLTGVLTGFLPCGLVYAFALKAAAAGDPGRGVLLMLVFGLGTLPAMISVGLLGTVLSFRARRYLYRATGIVLLVLAAVTFTRGQTPWATSNAPACHNAQGEQSAP
jgi:hypothetical protein